MKNWLTYKDIIIKIMGNNITTIMEEKIKKRLIEIYICERMFSENKEECIINTINYFYHEYSDKDFENDIIDY